MAYEIPGFSFTLPAAADLSAKQFYALVCNSSKQGAVAGAGVAIVGVLQNKPNAAGKAATIVNKGVTKASAGAAITAGVGVETNAEGQFVTLASGVRVGTALDAAGADNAIFTVLLA